jgi:2,3-bisphosphoglycerate-independent phosphoglycerate mutase
MIILDGLGDRPCPDLDGRTPLEAAHTPNLDLLVAQGMTGLMDPLSPGLPVATDTGVGALMGLPAPQGLIPRGPIEAAGVGLQLNPGDVALRCNFATVSGDGDGDLMRLVDRRAGRIASGTVELAQTLTTKLPDFHGVRAVIRAATGHRAVMQLIGDNLDAGVTDMDPGAGWEDRGVLPCRPLDLSNPTAIRCADAINHFVAASRPLLEQHPVNQERLRQGLPIANLLLPRKAGKLSPIRGVVGALRLRAAVVAGECTLGGLARLLDMEWFHEPGFSGDADTDLGAKAAAAQTALQHHDLVFVHVKAPDLFAHDLDAVGKKAFIERVDRDFAALLREDIAIAVCADHSTPSTTGRHSGDPVPIILASPGGRRDRLRHYGESDAMQGGLGRITANGLLWSLLDQMNVTHNYRPNERRLLGLTGN